MPALGVTLHWGHLGTPLGPAPASSVTTHGDNTSPMGTCRCPMETPRHPVGDTAGPWGHAPWGPPGDTWTPLGAQCQSLGSDPMGTPRHPTGATANPPSFPPPPRGHPASTGDTQTPLGDTAGPRGHSALGTPGSPPHSQPVLPLGMSKSPSVSPPPGGARIPLWVPPPPLGTPPMCLQCPTAALPPLYKPLHCKYQTMYIAAAGGGTGTRRHRDTGKGLPSIPFPPPAPPPPPLLFFFPSFSLFRAFFCT